MNIKKFIFLKVIINLISFIIVLYGVVTCLNLYSKNIDSNYFILLFGITPIIFIIIGHISIFIHELGHGIALKILGFKIKIFKIGPIKYINNERNRKIAFDKLGLFLIGGYVTPEVNEVIYDQLSYDKFIDQYIKFIFSGIITTILIMVTAFILILFQKAIVVSVLILIVNWLILIKSFNNENLNFGDFYLIKFLKDKPNYICAMLQNNIMIEYPMNSFLLGKMEEFLKEKIIQEEYNELIFGLADKILDEYIIQQKQPCDELEKLKKWVFNKYNQMDKNFIFNLTILKLSHKFLLYEYALKMKREFITHYNIVNKYVMKKHILSNYKITEGIMETLKILSMDGNLLDAKKPYIISDLEFIISECDNCKKKIKIIVNRLSE